MGYKNKEKQKEYQKNWYLRKKTGKETRTTKKLSEKESKLNKIQIKKRWETKIRKERDKIFGTTCYFCGHTKTVLHRKNGIPHPGSIKFIKIAMTEPKEWVKLCGKCHTGVHFCMNTLHLNWGQIEKLYNQEIT